MLDADLERAYLLAQEKELNERLESGKNTAQDTEEYAYVQSRLLEMEAWSAEARYLRRGAWCFLSDGWSLVIMQAR